MQAVDAQWAWSPYVPSAGAPWDRRRAAHLYRRAGLGADAPTLDAALRMTPAEVVDSLFRAGPDADRFDRSAAALANATLAFNDPKRLSAAWVYRLAFTPEPLRENMTLFWHGHFATSADKVDDAKLMWRQNELLRRHALGDFKELAQRIAQDPAMLIYLDSAINRKAHPNENFARELMELFCLGEGHYSEGDVLELARCFTGWEIKNDRFRKNRYQQDTGEKCVLGVRGKWDGEDAVDVVLQQPSVELFLARKWYRYFIADEPAPSDEFLQPIAQTFREHDLETAPAIGQLLRSSWFFSEHAIARKIKSPVNLVIGMLRSLSCTTNMDQVATSLIDIGQGLFYPPNVKGWEGGREWINSSTLLGRSNLFAKILDDKTTRFGGTTLAGYLASLDKHDAQAAIDFFESLLLAVPLDGETKRDLLQAAEQIGGDFERSLRAVLHGIVSLPQCQIA